MADELKPFYGSGIPLVAGFDYGKEAPLDARLLVNTISDLDAHVAGKRAYPGMQVYVVDTGRTFQRDLSAPTVEGVPSGWREIFHFTEETIKAWINNLTSAAMIFRGTLGTNGTISDLPNNPAEIVGDTYKVITDGTYAGQQAYVGDTFIASENGWILIPSGDDLDDTWREIKVNGTRMLANGNTTGAIDFVAGDNITLAVTDGKLTISSAFQDTHYEANLVISDNDNGQEDVVNITNGNVRLNLVENEEVRSTHLIKGEKAISVTTDANGNIVISATDSWRPIKINGNDFLSDLNTSKALDFINGAGITLTKNDQGQVTIGHTNKIISGTAQGGSGGLTYGGAFTIPKITYDTEGHITAVNTTIYTLPGSDNTFREIKVEGTQVLAQTESTSLNLLADTGLKYVTEESKKGEVTIAIDEDITFIIDCN